MTKVKSKKKTIEDVLVSVEEQPYEVPENWCWIHLLDSFDNVTDSKKKLPTKEYQEEGKFSIVDQGQNFVGGFTNREDMVHDGKLPVVIFGDHTRCVKYVDFPFVQGADGVKVLRPKALWDSKAFYYALQSVEIPNMGYRRHYPLFKNFSIPVPPISEQQRIVEQIESLYSKLDEAKDKAQEVIDGFDSRRASILAQAFSGKLTEKWRRENKYSLDDWKETTLSEVVSGFKYGSSEKSTYENNGMPVLRIPNIGDGVIDFSDMKFLAHNDVDRDNQVHEDDLLIIRSNGSRDLVGKCAIVPELERDYAYASFLIRIKPSEGVLPRFLLLYMNSSIARSQMFIKAKSSSGIHNINSKELGAIKVRIPYLEEQNEIVRFLDEIFAKENEARILAETVVDKIEEIKKSVLAKAFRGKLGTNDSLDEPAEELLKRILTEAPVEEKKKSITRKKKVKVCMNKEMLEAVREAGKITPEKLKEETGLGIDEFYEELKRLTESRQIEEKREGKEVYLEIRDAN